MTTIVRIPYVSYKEYCNELKGIQIIEGIKKVEVILGNRKIIKYNFTEV